MFNKFSSSLNYDNFQPIDTNPPIIISQKSGINGRIFIDPNVNNKPYELYQDSSKAQNTNVSIISNIIVPSVLSRNYFSNDNIECLQNQIIKAVFSVSQKQISKQSYQDLQIIMKSIYLQYGRNLPNNIEEQIVKLNKYVVDECVKIIVPNMLQYTKYLDEISSPVPTMQRAQNVSIKGNKWGDFTSLIPS